MAEVKAYSEPELTEATDLCLPDGSLNRKAVGWSRRPLHNCNLSGSPLRKKRWNYWCVTTDNFLFSATLSDIDYLGLAFIYFLDFKTKQFHELTVDRLLGKGCNLGNFVTNNVYFEDAKLMLSFINGKEYTEIKVKCPDFGGQTLTANLLVTSNTNHETLNVVIPWSDKRFQFTSKQNTMPTKGSITIGEKKYSADKGFACLDFGRGKWPFSSFWNWAASSGISNGHTIGLNFGAGWTDGTGMNENGICIDGVLSKISEDITFDYNQADYMKPWKIKTTLSKLVDLQFTPFFERVAKTNALFLGSEVHQMIGHFKGAVTDSGGKVYEFDNLIGWAEDHHARW